MLIRYLVVLLTLVSLGVVVFAQDTNTFFLKSEAYLPLQEIEVNFDLATCSENLKIRAVSDVGLVEMRNEASNVWTSSYIDLTAKHALRVKNVNNKKVTIYFEIFNNATGSVTKTENVSIWLSDAYTTYIKRLNNNINSN